MNWNCIEQLADAVLYEGYILYPYRASAVKNRQRFNFGVLMPPAYCEEQLGHELPRMQTQCVVTGETPVIDLRIRFLQLVSREVYRRSPAASDGSIYERVAELHVDGDLYHPWQEAIEREIKLEALDLRTLLAEPRQLEFNWPASDSSETLSNREGKELGKLVRWQKSVQGRVMVSANSLEPGMALLTIEIENKASLESGMSRDQALLHSLASVHTLLHTSQGEFVSLLDPPTAMAAAISQCQNEGTWPVLVGEEGERNTMLSSPIILYDYPQVAPESGGDFCDGTEIDEMLALRVMTLTDEEQREMRHVDARARKILERTQSMQPPHWQQLHGTMREIETVKGEPNARS